MSRRPYLDWLRGIAVLIMIEGHTLDSWTREADRVEPAYRWAIVVAGFGAPIFLFLAGVALTLAAGARVRKGLSAREVSRAAVRRGLWILALAFLFRLQSALISGGQLPQALLKVDILNVMGVSMVIGALCWAVVRTQPRRVALFTVVTVAVALFTPVVRNAAGLAALPDPLEAYLRPVRGLTGFALFPWAGFLTAGAAVGAWLESGRTSAEETVANRWLAVFGAAVAIAAYAASFGPPLLPNTSFWTSSPAFFALRTGLLMLSVPVAFAISRTWRGTALQEFGRASLFVYWVHVELVYGVLSAPLHRRLPFPVALLAFAFFSLAMFGLVRLKERGPWKGQPTEPLKRSTFPAAPTTSRNSI